MVLLQWITAQVGLSGNEIADHLFKLDDDMIQPVVGSSSKGLKAHPHERNQFLEEKSRAKWFWKKKKKLEQLAIPQQRLPIKLPKRTTSAIFQLATCHDYLQVYVFRIAPYSDICSLCSNVYVDAEHFEKA